MLHDIGKVPDDEPELPHAILGMKLAEKYGSKLEYYSYGGSGSSGGSANSAVRKIIVSKASKSYLNSPDHMKTNLEALKSLKSQF